MAQPVPVRVGGFGGSEGLAAFLQAEGFDLLIDATHPFANRISANAGIAARETDVQAFTLRRPGWIREPDDRWTNVQSIEEAVDALGKTPRNVFLAIGRQEVFHFEKAPQHRYLIRSVDPVKPEPSLPDVRFILATGPFAEDAEHDLLIENRIDVIVAKNSGGDATYGKIAAARALGIAVVMVERRPAADMRTVTTVEEALGLIDHIFSPKMKRGV